MHIARITRLLAASVIGIAAAIHPADLMPKPPAAVVPDDMLLTISVQITPGPAAIPPPVAATEPADAERPPAQTAPAVAPPRSPAGPATLRPVKVMPLGDSITFGVGSSTHDGYRKDLWVRLRRVGLALNFVGTQRSGRIGDNNHEGHIGYRIDQLSSRITPWLALYKPDIVLLHIGTNDLAQDYDMKHAPARLSLLIDRIRAARPTARIFVASLISMKSSQRGLAQKRSAYNAAIPAIVKRKGPMVSFVPQQLVPAKDLSDSAHPTNCGYAKMSYIWYYYLGRSTLSKSGKAWPTGYYPYGSGAGPCH